MIDLAQLSSDVDPVARDAFWRILAELSRRDRVTIFFSTHLNGAERCDPLSLMHEGRVLVTDAPTALSRRRGVNTLEEAFVGHLEEAVAAGEDRTRSPEAAEPLVAAEAAAARAQSLGWRRFFDPRRMASYARCEALELRRDPIRLTLALLGSVILMFVMDYGISLDVEDLTFAVLDRDQTTVSRDYTLNIAGSR